MPRRLLSVLLVLGLAPAVWLQEPPPRPNSSQSLHAEVLELPANPRLGPFRLTGAWHLTSPNSDFGGYSALLSNGPGRLVTFSDMGVRLDLPMPGTGGPVRIARLMPDKNGMKASRDVESAAHDPATGGFWLALEGRNLFLHLVPGEVAPRVVPGPELAGWPSNSGAEAMTRLSDGRFLILAEAGDTVHEGRLLPLAPDGVDHAQRFTFITPPGYRPTDVAQLPDGRVLILLRELRWPLPPRFGTRLVLADPSEIAAGQPWRGRVIAGLDGTGLEENYEGLAIVPGQGGKLNAWLISDDNAAAATQRTLLLRLEFRLSDLPPRASPAKQKAPG
ncbi:MAG: hypothetical protein RL519_1790 [Pseudomonadota bacterium]